MSCTDAGKALAKKKLSELTEDEKTLRGELQVSVGRITADQRDLRHSNSILFDAFLNSLLVSEPPEKNLGRQSRFLARLVQEQIPGWMRAEWSC
jgi:hypothetical protein